MARLIDHFIIPLYKLIFEQDPPCMSREVMEAIVNIANWYVSPGGTFIRVFGRENPLHVLSRYATNKLVMQEVSYDLAIGLSIGLHRKKKVPWPTLPLWTSLYKIEILKDSYVKDKDIVKFEFDTKDFNPYDPHSICKDHCTQVYILWIHETFHWLKDDHRRYCKNASRLNDLVSLARNWKVSLQTSTTLEATTIIAEGNNPVQDKGKRKITLNPEGEKSCKMNVDPIMEKETLVA